MLTEFSLDALKSLDDGRVLAAFQLELRRAGQDCVDRPGDKKPRTVQLEFRITPVVEDDGSCERVEGEFEIKSKVPTRKSKTYSFRVNKKGHFAYSSTNPDNVEQTTFDDLDADGRVNRKNPE